VTFDREQLAEITESDFVQHTTETNKPETAAGRSDTEEIDKADSGPESEPGSGSEAGR
jgi:hypothetical protein